MFLTQTKDQLLAFRQAVEAASSRTEVHDSIHALYDALQDAIDLRQPRCSASGKCCNFDAYGHRLYTTTAELATFLHDLRQSQSSVLGTQSSTCPYQQNNLCSAHPIRPFGCRIFFCDPTATLWQQDQYERFHTHLKHLHGRLNIPYHYMEWRQALQALSNL
jgi:Fe-S-cluster containining protein